MASIILKNLVVFLLFRQCQNQDLTSDTEYLVDLIGKRQYILRKGRTDKLIRFCLRQNEMQKETHKEKKESDISVSDSDTENIKKCEYKGEFYGELPYFIGIGEWSPVPSEIEKQHFVEEYLEPGESTAMICLLEDAIDELNILKYIIGAPMVHWHLDYKTTTEKYSRRLTPTRIFPEIESKPILTSAIKIQGERESIEVVFNQTTNALLENRSFTPLSKAVESLKKEEEDDVSLVQELKKNLLYLKDLKVRVEEKKKSDEREEKEREEFLYKLQDELDDVKLKCNLEENLVQKWENVRKAQNVWRLNIEENFFRENIQKLSTKIKIEKRVTYELQLYLRANQIELEEQLEEWMVRYDSELERRENKILQLKYSRDQTEEKKHQLQQMYQGRVSEIKEWIEFREIRKRRTGASLVIQSWWRGMMVRKKLGPYKPTKKQKGEKK